MSALTIEADGEGSVTVDALRFTDGKARVTLYVYDDDTSGGINLDAPAARELSAYLVECAEKIERGEV